MLPRSIRCCCFVRLFHSFPSAGFVFCATETTPRRLRCQKVPTRFRLLPSPPFATLEPADEFRHDFRPEDVLQKEFEKLARYENSVIQTIRTSPEAPCEKDRYVDILPYNETVVTLESGQYINANHIEVNGSSYIATQWPLSNTLGDFWGMVCQYECPMVVNVQGLGRANHGRYWPSSETPLLAGDDLLIHCESGTRHTHFDEFVVRATDIRMNEEEEEEVNELPGGDHHDTHVLLFRGWEDFDIPDGYDSLKTLLDRMDEILDTSSDSPGPIVCHCSAGVGRSGALLSVHSILCAGIERRKDVVFETVKELRMAREGMVQTLEQYSYIDSFVWTHRGSP